MKKKSRHSRGDSTVISTLLLTATVIAIGLIAWSATIGISAINRTDYFDQSVESIKNIQERFIIENIGINYAANNLTICVFNYGSIDITVTIIRVEIDDISFTLQVGKYYIETGTRSVLQYHVEGVALGGGSQISVEITTERSNKTSDVTQIQ